MVEISNSDKSFFIAVYDIQNEGNKFIKQMSVNAGISILGKFDFDTEEFAKSIRLDQANKKIFILEPEKKESVYDKIAFGVHSNTQSS